MAKDYGDTHTVYAPTGIDPKDASRFGPAAMVGHGRSFADNGRSRAVRERDRERKTLQDKRESNGCHDEDDDNVCTNRVLLGDSSTGVDLGSSNAYDPTGWRIDPAYAPPSSEWRIELADSPRA
eukprot:626320-Rhodomonas_salina.1